MYKTLILPLIATILLHASIVLMFLVDWDGSDSRVLKIQPSYIKARLVTLDKPKAQPVKKTTAPAKKAAPAKKPAVDTAAKKQAEAKQQELAKQREATKQRQKAEQEQQQRQEQQRREQELAQEAERELAQAIAAEAQQQQAANDFELAASYIGMMTQIIQNNWSRPPSARNNMEAELIIQLVPTGEVVSVDVIKSSGNAAFDRSAVKAVEKADRFPELQNLPNRVFEQNFRRLRIKFRPEDLRL